MLALPGKVCTAAHFHLFIKKLHTEHYDSCSSVACIAFACFYCSIAVPSASGILSQPLCMSSILQCRFSCAQIASACHIFTSLPRTTLSPLLQPLWTSAYTILTTTEPNRHYTLHRTSPFLPFLPDHIIVF